MKPDEINKHFAQSPVPKCSFECQKQFECGMQKIYEESTMTGSITNKGPNKKLVKPCLKYRIAEPIFQTTFVTPSQFDLKVKAAGRNDATEAPYAPPT